MKTILIFDSNALCWGAFHSLPALTHEEFGTTIIYGFLNKLFSIQQYTEADFIAFAWDSRSSKRIKLFPEYKSKRRTAKEQYTPEEIKIHEDRDRQFKLLRDEIIPALGFVNNFTEKGLEGDDIIASISKSYSTDHRVRIVARDGDLYQLINTNCTMYDPTTQSVIDEEYIFEKYGVYPDMWADIKGIAGCVGDEVPGIPGIGTDRAIKYLLGRMKVTSSLYKRIVSNEDIIKLTRALVVLPFKGTPTYILQEDKCRVNKLKKVAAKYGLESYLSEERLLEFRRNFCHAPKNTITEST